MRASPVPTLADILPPERNGFGTLRLAAALAVVLSHSFYLPTAVTAAEPLYAATGFTLGQHAVHLFFVMSGVMVSASLERSGGVGAYLAARALRIFPGLVVCVLLTALVLGPLVGTLAPLDYLRSPGVYAYILKTATLSTGNAPLPGVFESLPAAGQIDIPLWTLKYEVLCYLALAALLVAGAARLRLGLTLFGAGAFALYVASELFPGLPRADSSLGQGLRLAAAFGLGVVAYAWRAHLPLTLLGPAATFLVYAICHSGPLQGPATVLLAAALVLWIGRVTFGPFDRWTRRTDLSYGVYIYGWPIGQTVLTLQPDASPPLMLAATCAVLLPTALLSWTLVEKPALALKGLVRPRPGRSEPPPEPAVSEPAAAPEASQEPSVPSAAARRRLARIAGSGGTAAEAAPAGL